MLVLSREIGESVVLPSCRTRFTILRVAGQRVRVGIDAPAAVAVHREETWQRIPGLRLAICSWESSSRANARTCWSWMWTLLEAVRNLCFSFCGATAVGP